MGHGPRTQQGVGRFRSWLTWVGWQRFVFVFAAAPVVGFVAWWLVRLPAPPIESMIPVAPSPATVAAQSPPEWLASLDTGATPNAVASLDAVAPSRIAVHVVGAVVQPGVYHLSPDARADDALRAAGGATANADLRRVNLAAVVRDGEQLYIPRVGERVSAPTGQVGNQKSSVNTSHSGDGSGDSPAIVDLNRATAVDLDRLPGVGPSTAKAIIDHRTRNGPFASIDDLLAVRGIGPAKLAEIRPWVRV